MMLATLAHRLALLGCAALWLQACSEPLATADFSRCQSREVLIAAANIRLHDCPLGAGAAGVDRLRFIEMSAHGANVIAMNGRDAVAQMPSSVGLWAVAYGKQRFTRLSVLLPHNADTQAWRAAGWQLAEPLVLGGDPSAGPGVASGIRAVWQAS